MPPSGPDTSTIERRIASAELIASARTREGVISLLHHSREQYKEWVRRAVLQRNRLDILCALVLGYHIHPAVHFPIIQHQFANPESMILAARGFGKTSIGTIAKVIHYILGNRNIRILIGSKVADNAEGMLSEVKGHFENNQELQDIFGEFVGDREWGRGSIQVKGRTTWRKEPTVTTVGVGSGIASKHVDVGIADDLVDEENSRTDHQRANIKTWFYKVFKPIIEPPDPTVPHRGELHVLGTRYHYADLHGHFLEHEFKGGKTLSIPSLDENDESTYPERFPTEFLHKLREEAGIIIFNSQYQLSTEAMRGEVFDFDNCDVSTMFPPMDGLTIGMGSDLAIGKKSASDFFTIVVVGRDERDHIWVLDFLEQRLSFYTQQTTIEDYYRRYERWLRECRIDAQSYQAVQSEELIRKHRDWRILPWKTHTDKVTRAHKLSPIFEQHRIHFRPDQHHLIERLVTFPHGHDDLFDALDLAIAATRSKKKRAIRDEEPGLL